MIWRHSTMLSARPLVACKARTSQNLSFLFIFFFFIRFVLRSYKKLYEKASAKPRKRSPRVKVPASDGERGELRVGQTDEAHAPHQNYGIMMIPSDFGNI